MAKLANLDTLQLPRLCGRQTQRNNVEGRNPIEYFKGAIYLPFLDSLINQLDMRFQTMSSQAIRGLSQIWTAAIIIQKTHLMRFLHITKMTYLILVHFNKKFNYGNKFGQKK